MEGAGNWGRGTERHLAGTTPVETVETVGDHWIPALGCNGTFPLSALRDIPGEPGQQPVAPPAVAIPGW